MDDYYQNVSYAIRRSHFQYIEVVFDIGQIEFIAIR